MTKYIGKYGEEGLTFRTMAKKTALGDWLYATRKKLDLQQADIADLTKKADPKNKGLSVGYIGDLERGDEENPTIKNLLLLIDTLGVPRETAFEDMMILETRGRRRASLLDSIFNDPVLSPSYKKLIIQHYKEKMAEGAHLKEPPSEKLGS